jgi:hypothetical protein
MNLKKQLAFSFFAEGEESARQIIEDVQDRVSIVELRLDQLSSSCDLQLLVNAFPQITFIFSNRSSPIKSLSVILGTLLRKVMRIFMKYRTGSRV